MRLMPFYSQPNKGSPNKASRGSDQDLSSRSKSNTDPFPKTLDNLSIFDYLSTMKEPLSSDDARRVFREILESGEVAFTDHAYDEMGADGLSEQDCKNVIRAGWVEKTDFIKGSWRYQMNTRRMAVVCRMRSEDSLVVVTAWRFKA